MAIRGADWQLFAQILNYIRNAVGPARPIRLLSLGYTDIMVSPAEVAAAFGDEVAAHVSVKTNADDIVRWHRGTSQVIETDSLYRALGFAADYLDVQEVRGGEIIQDLNEPFPDRMIGAYDAVIDSGTLEHCFNVGQAIKNIASALRVGGIVNHGNPMVMINHGFYNFSPQFYYEFYLANGFKILDMFAVKIAASGIAIERLDGIARYRLPTPDDRTLQVIARKERDAKLIWPTQTKYRANPGQVAPTA
ncbi:MAG: class I SAM-dependent methyltransferase [Rhodospirillaceae bacterium]|nr:class I SAM-dependent methyltransferase [Rhodospirillaceae bacterium]